MNWFDISQADVIRFANDVSLWFLVWLAVGSTIVARVLGRATAVTRAFGNFLYSIAVLVYYLLYNRWSIRFEWIPDASIFVRSIIILSIYAWMSFAVFFIILRSIQASRKRRENERHGSGDQG